MQNGPGRRGESPQPRPPPCTAPPPRQRPEKKGVCFKRKPLVGVYNLCGAIGAGARHLGAIVQMHMAVHKIAGPVLVQQFCKRLKALVRAVRPVVQAQGRRMRQQNVKPTVAPQRQPQAFAPPLHFLLGILERPLFITDRPAQPQHAHAAVFINGIFHADAAFRRRLLISSVMVAVHIQHRRPAEGGQKREVLRRHIPAGEDQVHIAQLVRAEMVPQIFGFFICNSQYLHCAPPFGHARPSVSY